MQLVGWNTSAHSDVNNNESYQKFKINNSRPLRRVIEREYCSWRNLISHNDIGFTWRVFHHGVFFTVLVRVFHQTRCVLCFHNWIICDSERCVYFWLACKCAVTRNDCAYCIYCISKLHALFICHRKNFALGRCWALVSAQLKIDDDANAEGTF